MIYLCKYNHIEIKWVGIMKNFVLKSEYIELQQLLKIENYISSGGEAKYFLASNEVYVNND